MPIYKYECTACGHYQEALQKLSDDPLLECSACGEAALKKLITSASFRLSGSGWYETDFKSDNRRNIAAKDSKDPTETSKKTSEQDSKKTSDQAGKKTSGPDGQKVSSQASTGNADKTTTTKSAKSTEGGARSN